MYNLFCMAYKSLAVYIGAGRRLAEMRLQIWGKWGTMAENEGERGVRW